MRYLLIALTLIGAAAVRAAAQTCTAVHYRWPVKVDSAFAGAPATAVDITEILTDWDPRNISARDRCAERVGREDSVYVVTGWVRRIKRSEKDGDWHIEITEEEESPVTDCIVAEIPNPEYGTVYARARDELNALVNDILISARGDLEVPVLLRFTGAAFYDGTHRTHPRNGGPSRAKQHGRCNSSLRALWELHPVYHVEAENP